MGHDRDTLKSQYREYIGGFVIAFEEVCHIVRTCITFSLHGDGLKTQTIAQAITADLTANQLHNMLMGIAGVAATKQKDEHLQAVVKHLLNRYRKLIEVRNEFLHSYWTVDHIEEDSNIGRVKFTNSAQGPRMSSKESASPDLSEIYRWIKESEELFGLFLSLVMYLNEAFEKSHEEFTTPEKPGYYTTQNIYKNQVFVFEQGLLKSHKVSRSRFTPKHEATDS